MNDPASSPSDIDLLRHTFPSWSFASVWNTANSGPDKRRLVAVRGETVLTAWDADSLASQVTAMQIAELMQDGEL